MSRSNNIKYTVIAGICLALCMYLPFLTMNFQPFGQAISLMHIPVLLCGFFCGARYGAIVGATAPLLRFMLFGMPPIMPMGVAMCFELAVYGLTAALFYKWFPKKAVFVYISLILSMLFGRIVWGLAMWRLSEVVTDVSFGFRAFLDGAFIYAWVGIVLHIIVIPPIVIVVNKIIRS